MRHVSQADPAEQQGPEPGYFDSQIIIPRDGRPTSFRLEPQFWASLKQVARLEKATITEIVEHAVREYPSGSRSSAIRVFLHEYFRQKYYSAWANLRAV